MKRFLFLFFFILAGCSEERKSERYIFGTLVEVTVYGESRSKADAVINDVMREFERLHKTLHAWQPSEITDLNAAFSRQEKIRVSPQVQGIIEDAKRLSDESDGLFNPAIGRLIALWGFQSDDFKPVRPDPEKIKKLVQDNPKMEDIAVGNGYAGSRNPAVSLDLGGYAKGWALDAAKSILKRDGVENALVNIGGNIMALGAHGRRPWHVGIRDPRGSGAIAELDLLDGEAVGTSGDYQRYFLLDGKRYCHIIDPRTGYPAQGVEAVTVVIPKGAHSGALSDAASKPLFISGVKGWREAARKMHVNEAMLVDSNGKIHVTKALKERLSFEKEPRDLDVAP